MRASSGAEKKDAAMSFLQNALAMTDAVAAREIVQPEKFKEGISKIIDGTVQCLNASTWAKVSPRSRGKSRFDNQLPVAGRIRVGAKALAAQVLLRQARKEAADAE